MRYFLRDLLGFTLWAWRGLVALFLLMWLIVWALVSAYRADAVQWTEFVLANECQLVGKRDGHTSVGTGVTSSGSVGTITTTSPDEEGWFCAADGLTYWKRAGMYRPELLENENDHE